MDWIGLWNQTTNEPGRDISAYHIHDRCEMLYLVEGKIEMKIANTVYTLNAGQMAIINQLEMHNLIPLELPYRRIGIHVRSNLLGRQGIPPFLTSVLEYHPSGWCHIFDLRDQPRIQETIEELWQEYHTPQPAAREMVGVLFHRLLLLLYRYDPSRFRQASGDKEMEEARRYLEENLSNGLSISQLAERYYLTSSHFIVRFKKHTGYTPQKYRNLCRMSKARTLLLETQLPLNAVAEESGFSDLNSFVRAFHQFMNITPGRFRTLASDITLEPEWLKKE